MGDRTRICQIMLNLEGNSVKFTEEGGITIDLKIIEQTQNNVTIRFAVNDTGIGIAADKWILYSNRLTSRNRHYP